MIVYENPAVELVLERNSVAGIQVTDSRKAWSQIASLFEGNPEQRLKLIGVTGTNGKSSTVWMLTQLLRAAGEKVLSVGTLGADLEHELIPTHHTTPDPNFFYPLLARALAEGITYVVMEVSSHSMAQGKLDPVKFDAAGWTNFTRDHLDFHGSLEEYWEAKKLLFTRHLKPEVVPILNDSLLPRFRADLDLSQLKWWTYSLNSSQDCAPYSSQIIETSTNGSTINFRSPKSRLTLESPYFGSYQAENLTLALALFDQVYPGESPSLDHLRDLLPVPGRLELVRDKNKNSQPLVFVDYAHTPDALERALTEVRRISKNARILCVFGCGGNRDRGKRPLMAKVAAQHADSIYLTNDNPRQENPRLIISEILQGFEELSVPVHVEEDRMRAICLAIAAASCNDIVLIAGKGHETYQIIGDQTFVFDDRIAAHSALKERKA